MHIAGKEDRSEIIVFVLLLSFLFLYFYRLGAPAVWNPNEAFYAETPREMLQRHDLLTPYFNYDFRFEKPVFMYWAVLPFYKLMGINATAVRMVSAISAVLGVLVTFWFASKVLESRKAGLISAAMLAAAFDYNSAARYASPEMLLTLLITASIVVFYRWYTAGPKYRGLWRLLFYFLCGLSTLTKGPIGIILPFLVIIVFLLIKRDFASLKAFFSVAGFALYLAVALPWYGYMLYRYGSQFSSVVIGENVQRFLSNKSGESALFYYFSVLPWNFLPGSLFLIPAFLWIRKLAKAHEAIVFPVVWFCVVFVFFSFSKSKLPPYIYPLFPAAATIAGGWIAMAIAGDGKAAKVLIWLAALLLAVIAAAVVWLKSYLPDMGIITLSLPVIFLLIGLWNKRKKAALLSLVLVLAGMSFFYFVFLSDVLPQIEKYRPYREIAAKVAAADPGDTSPFYCYKVCQQNLTFYLRRKVSTVGSSEELAKLLDSPEHPPVLMEKKTYEENYASPGRRVIWDGPFYEKSESQFMKFLLDIRRHRINEYVVVR